MEESLEKRLFNKKENGWQYVDDEEKGKIFNLSKKYIDFLNRKEQTWVFILSCILLCSIGFKEKDYYFACFVIALIIGKFFWLDNTISDFKEIFHDIKHLGIDVIFVLVYCIYYILLVLFNESNVLIGIVGSVLGFILGILLYAYTNKNKGVSQ